MNDIKPKHPFWPIAKRGLRGRCPNCGEGNLFARYLKPVERCASCGEELGHIRADDGPAWLTIMIVGHVFAALVVLDVLMALPDWVQILGWCAVVMGLVLLILPRAKGFFIALIWRSRCAGSEK